VLDGIFWQMPQHLDRTRAADVDAVIRWCITGRGSDTADVYQLEIGRGRCRTSRGHDGTNARLTVTMDAIEFVRLVSGTSDPTQAYFRGRVKLAGDMMLAAKLQVLFRLPARSVTPASRLPPSVQTRPRAQAARRRRRASSPP
jgi:putative sterol carrier protein